VSKLIANCLVGARVSQDGVSVRAGAIVSDSGLAQFLLNGSVPASVGELPPLLECELAKQDANGQAILVVGTKPVKFAISKLEADPKDLKIFSYRVIGDSSVMGLCLGKSVQVTAETQLALLLKYADEGRWPTTQFGSVGLFAGASLSLDVSGAQPVRAAAMAAKTLTSGECTLAKFIETLGCYVPGIQIFQGDYTIPIRGGKLHGGAGLATFWNSCRSTLRGSTKLVTSLQVGVFERGSKTIKEEDLAKELKEKQVAEQVNQMVKKLQLLGVDNQAMQALIGSAMAGRPHS